MATQRELELTDRLTRVVYKATEMEKELVTTKSLLADAQGVAAGSRKNVEDLKVRLSDAQLKFFTERTRNEQLHFEVQLLRQTIAEMQSLQFPSASTAKSIAKSTAKSTEPLAPQCTTVQPQPSLKRTPVEVWQGDAEAVVSRPLTMNAVKTIQSGQSDFSGEVLDSDGLHAVIDAHILGSDCEFSLVFKLAKPLANFAVTPEPRRDFTLLLDLHRNTSVVIEFSGKLIVTSPFETPPVLCASWLSAEGAVKTVYFSLPLPLTKFMAPGATSAMDVMSSWQGSEGTDQVLVVRKAKQWGIAELGRALSQGGCLAVVPGLDAVGVVLTGVYLNGCEVVARVELGMDVRVKGQARISVRSQSAFLAKATARSLAVILGQ